MRKALTLDDLRAAVPELTGTLRLKGLEKPIAIYRDRLGIPHVHAQSVDDAFFAQGFVHAQDRLWQMDYDRHRAYGHWPSMPALALFSELEAGSNSWALAGSRTATGRPLLEPQP